MPPGFSRLLLGWVALILLWAALFGLSFVHMSASVRPVLLVIPAAMIAVLALIFMHVRKGPVIVVGFAVMAVFWMIVLLGLGSMDPLTRVQYSVSADRPA